MNKLRLFHLRTENKMTQDELCKILSEKYDYEINKSMISRYEKGIHEPNYYFIDLVSSVFGVTSDYMMGRSDNKYFSDNTAQRKVPILGTIAAGLPITATENILGYEYTDDNCDFCLKVKGDSMIGARIYDGDIVFIRKQPDIESGEIAAVIIDNEEATLKRILKVNGTVILHPENPNYKDLIFTKKDFKQVKILGKVRYFKAEVK
jgi:repressor LexA